MHFPHDPDWGDVGPQNKGLTSWESSKKWGIRSQKGKQKITWHIYIYIFFNPMLICHVCLDIVYLYCLDMVFEIFTYTDIFFTYIIYMYM